MHDLGTLSTEVSCPATVAQGWASMNPVTPHPPPPRWATSGTNCDQRLQTLTETVYKGTEQMEAQPGPFKRFTESVLIFCFPHSPCYYSFSCLLSLFPHHLLFNAHILGNQRISQQLLIQQSLFSDVFLLLCWMYKAIICACMCMPTKHNLQFHCLYLIVKLREMTGN